MQIDLIDDQQLLSESLTNLIIDCLQHTAKVEKVPTNSELSLVIVTNEEIKALNHEYRNKDAVTDVLSFPMDDFSEQMNEAPIMLGDIVISLERAEEQATNYNHSIEREVAFLAVHGLLHLLGYTHDTKDEEKVMFQKQEDVMKVFNLER